MENETQTQTQTPEEKDPIKDGEDKPISIVDEARGLRDDIRKEKEELKAERKKLQEARAEEVLSSSAGGHIEPVKPKEETPKEYNERIEKEMSEGKHAD